MGKADFQGLSVQIIQASRIDTHHIILVQRGDVRRLEDGQFGAESSHKLMIFLVKNDKDFNN